MLTCCRYFWLNAGILAAGLVVYTIIARGYTEKPVTDVNKVRPGLGCRGEDAMH